MRHISRLKKFLWYGSVAFLVLLAIVVTVARLTIDSVSDYRGRLEELAGQYLGQPVTISDMDARLVGFKPSVVLGDVALREHETGEQLAHFSEISIALNPLSSLRHLAPIMDLTIAGANIVIVQQLDGTFRLQGVSLSQHARDSGSGGALGAWFLDQSSLTLIESRIIWHSAASGKDVAFEGVNLELQNLQSQHRLNARVSLPDELGKELRLALDISGNLLDLRDWAGELYLKTVGVKPARWLKGLAYGGVGLEQGSIDLEMWSRWANGVPSAVEGVADLSGLALSRDGKRLPVTRLGAQFRYRKQADDWRLSLQKTIIQNGPERVLPFRLEVQQRGGISSVRAHTLDIGRLMSFLEYIPGLPGEYRERLGQMAPKGRVDSLRVDLREDQLLGAVASFTGLQVAAVDKLPGVAGLDASLRFDGERGQLRIDSDELVLDLPELFAKPLPLQQTRGTVRAEREGEGWRVVAEQLEIRNPDIRLQAQLGLQWQPGEAPLIAMSGRFYDGRAKAVPHYLPVKVMHEQSTAWLKQAFVSGKVEQGALLLHGRLDHSLLRGAQGRLAVHFTAHDVTLDYKPGWPLLEAIRGEARFTGAGMEVDVASARIFHSLIGPSSVRIPHFDRAVLDIEGGVYAIADDALQFLRESALLPENGLPYASGEGVTPISLKMSIPLSPSVAEDAPLNIRGTVTFNNTRLKVARGLELQQINGELAFTHDTFTASNITTRLYDHPATLTVFTENARDGRRGSTIVAARGHTTAAALRRELQLPILERLEGETDWQANLALRRGERGSIVLDVFSTLDGMAVNLPAPMAKREDESRSLALSLVLGGEEAGRGHLHYGKVMKAAWLLDPGSGQPRRVAIGFGNGKVPALPAEDGIYLGGVLQRFDWRPWREIVRTYASSGSGDAPLPITLRMQRLHLPASAAKAGGEPLDPALLPVVDFVINRFGYGELELGRVAGRLVPDPRSVQFKQLSVRAPNFEIEGSGQWRKLGGSRFDVTLKSRNLGNMMRDLGFASVIKGGETRANGEVRWPGSPMEFDLSRVVAEGHVQIEKGKIKEVEAGAGKLLGLLSLQALPRRLFLDFTDLSGKGLDFNSIEGDLSIRNGNAQTENMVIKSLPADILVTGRTGLVARDFDQLIMVVPNVSDTVSVAGALAWGPQVAAALMVLQKIFKSDIDEATMTRYKVTGSWEKPVITRLEPLPLQTQETPAG